MNEKLKLLIIFFLISIAVASCNGNDNDFQNLEYFLYSRLCGAWDYGANYNSQVDYSWNSTDKDHNHSVIIDFDDEQPYIQIEGIGNLSISNILLNKLENIVYMTAFLERANRDFIFIIHLNDDGSIWFEKIGFLFGYGPEKPYSMTIGPEYNEDNLPLLSENIKEISHFSRIGVLNDSEVRIRKAPSLQGDNLGYLNINEEVVILDQTDSKMKIGDFESYWYQVITDTGLIGWSYGAFIDIE